MTDTNSISSKLKNKSFANAALEYHKHDNDGSFLSSYSDSSSTGSLTVTLIDQFLRLPDEQFFELVRKRLKIPIPEKQLIKWGIKEDREYWTENCSVDRLFNEMSQTVEIITSNGKTIRVRKYYNRALKIMKFICIAKSDLEFIIDISDLSPRLIAELKVLDKTSTEYVLKLAAAGIFENINPKQYHSRGFAKMFKGATR